MDRIQIPIPNYKKTREHYGDIIAKFIALAAVSFFVVTLPRYLSAEDPVAAYIFHPEEKNEVTEALKQDLADSVSPYTLEEVFSDPRLQIDPSVVRSGSAVISGYFGSQFGLLTERSLKTGVAYRKKYQAKLNEAQRIYGVDPAVILGILRVETYFGEHKTDRKVVNTLYSLYALSPDKKEFALAEMDAFLQMVDRQDIEAFDIAGSTVGAFGLPQFLPSSYLEYAVDGNNNGKIDIYENEDAIMSIANYLSKNGWRNDDASRRKAIYNYNHSKSYVDAVMTYASAIKKR